MTTQSIAEGEKPVRCNECGDPLGFSDTLNESFKTCRICGGFLCDSCWETRHVHLKGVKGALHK